MQRWEIKFYSMNAYTCARPFFACFLEKILPEDHFFMEVALNEAVNNAVFHGCKSISCSFYIKLEIMNNRRLIIRVEDKGAGFPGNRKLEEIEQMNEATLEQNMYQEKGRGLYLMYQVSDFISYNRMGNQVMMVKKLNADLDHTFEQKLTQITL